MKPTLSTQAILAALIVILPTCALAAPPQCVNIGTKSEGWRMPDGKLIWARCKGQVAYCGAIGTRSEGWYAAVIVNKELIRFDNCITGGTPWPVCVNIGTRSEGWQIGMGPVLYAQCAKKIAVCLDGSKSEGWYGAKAKSSMHRLRYENCSGAR